MLSVVEVRTIRGSLLTLPLEDISEGFVLQDVEGLDPVKATLVSSSVAGVDGEQYQSSQRVARDVKLVLGLLEPNDAMATVRDLRNKLYTFFMPKSEVGLRFYDSDGLVVDIWGRVEDFTCPLFVEEPEANISIRCFDPDFLDLEPTEVSWETSSVTNVPEGRLYLPYSGTVETGFETTLYVDRTVTEFTIYHSTYIGDVAETFDFAAPLIAGDVLKISTVSGAKKITLVRSGTETSFLWAKSPQSPWIELTPGDNFIRFYVEGAPMQFDLKYTKRYGGL